VARAVVQERGLQRVGLELSLGTQAADRMVGEPTTYSHEFFHAFGTGIADATPLLVQARAVKTAQEIERMRIANEIAAAAMQHVQANLRPGMRESEAAALWQGHVHGHGTARDDVELALGFSLRAAVGHLQPGAALDELDRMIRARIAEAGYPGQPSHPVAHGVGARAHEPPYAHQAGDGTIEEGMVLAIEPGCYWDEGGGLRLEDNFLVTATGAEKLSPFPDGVVTLS
jgi:Xaa-Pro aminopeptidase